MSRLILFNKPFGVLSQFSPSEHGDSLSHYINEKQVYPAGRLDKDSEGLLLLTDSGALQHQIAHPKKKMEKTYWVQVEGVPDETALTTLRQGVTLKDGITLPAQAKRIAPPTLWEREPPVRYRAAIPTSWLEIKIREGRNRQVRRMTAAVGFPTLRLVRYAVGEWNLGQLAPGEHTSLNVAPPQAAGRRQTSHSTKRGPRHVSRRTPRQRK